MSEAAALFDARKRAHRAFDPIWMTGTMTRTEAYAWLMKVLRVKRKDRHIATLSLAQCEQLILECQRYKKGVLQ